MGAPAAPGAVGDGPVLGRAKGEGKLGFHRCCWQQLKRRGKGGPSSSSPASSAGAPALPSLELDPQLKDLSEKKQKLQRSVVSLAAELKDVRGRLASQTEKRAKIMEEETCLLQRSLEKDGQLQASSASAKQYVKELENLSDELFISQATAEASVVYARSTAAQCLFLLKELDEKNSSLKEHEDRASRLGEQLDLLQKDLQAWELS